MDNGMCVCIDCYRRYDSIKKMRMERKIFNASSKVEFDASANDDDNVQQQQRRRLRWWWRRIQNEMNWTMKKNNANS